jgi:hypothetical protein
MTHQHEAAAPFALRADRAAAWAPWVAAGKPWPPPAGLLSATMGALLRDPFTGPRGRPTAPLEQAAYMAGLDARAEALRLIGSPEYRSGCKATHARVQTYFAEA